MRAFWEGTPSKSAAGWGTVQVLLDTLRDAASREDGSVKAFVTVLPSPLAFLLLWFCFMSRL